MIADRPRKEAALAFVAAWLAFMAGLVIGREVEDAVSLAIAGVIAAALVFLGFGAASHAGRQPRRVLARHAPLTLLSVAAGVGLGLANLAANKAIAAIDPRLRRLLSERMATLDPLEGLLASPLLEEITVRLFLMSAIAWVVRRMTKRADLALAIALVCSSLFFALLHLERPFPDDPALSNSYRAALVTKYALAGLPLGWMFWRWGLPYAILCHVAANAAHLVLQDRLF
jgi:membrane protease YdiL (CAAX protease family)